MVSLFPSLMRPTLTGVPVALLAGPSRLAAPPVEAEFVAGGAELVPADVAVLPPVEDGLLDEAQAVPMSAASTSAAVARPRLRVWSGMGRSPSVVWSVGRGGQPDAEVGGFDPGAVRAQVLRGVAEHDVAVHEH